MDPGFDAGCKGRTAPPINAVFPLNVQKFAHFPLQRSMLCVRKVPFFPRFLASGFMWEWFYTFSEISMHSARKEWHLFFSRAVLLVSMQAAKVEPPLRSMLRSKRVSSAPGSGIRLKSGMVLVIRLQACFLCRREKPSEKLLSPMYVTSSRTSPQRIHLKGAI